MTARPIARLVAVALIAGCGGTSSRRPHEIDVPVTSTQALALARVLHANLEHGGARFTASFSIEGQPVLATGRVDFRNGTGSAVVRPAKPEQGRERRYFWTRRAMLVQTTPGGGEYARQAPNPERDPVHSMAKFINLLAAETIDNTANIVDQDARFLGRTRLGNRDVDVYRYGPSGGTTLWVLARDGLLRRVRTTRTADPLTVDLITHEPVTIRLPGQRRR